MSMAVERRLFVSLLERDEPIDHAVIKSRISRDTSVAESMPMLSMSILGSTLSAFVLSFY